MKIDSINKSKTMIFALIFLMIFNGFFSAFPALAESDSQPPVIHSVEVTPQEAGVGDKVNVRAEITDDKSGVKSSVLRFYTPSKNRFERVGLEYNEKTELWEGEYEVKETDEAGRWTLWFIDAYDHAGNSHSYNPIDFENASEIGFDVVNPNGDSTPPVISSVKVMPQEVEVGDRVKVEAEVTDDKSGVKSSTLRFYTPSENRFERVPLEYNQESGLWEGEYEVKEMDEEGRWTLWFIDAYDYAGNSHSYDAVDFDNATEIGFDVINPDEDREAPVISRVEVTPQEVEVGGKVIVQAEITDDKSGVKSSTLRFYTPSQNRFERVGLKYNEETELWEGEYEVKETDEAGRWALWFIDAYDYAGNSQSYNPIDFENAFDIGFDVKAHSPDEGVDTPEAIEPLPHHYTTNNETWSYKSIDGDLFIGPESVLTINGNVTINGDVYVLGAIRNYGDLTITGTLHARSMNWGGSSTLYHGTVLMQGGSNQISSMHVSNQMYEVPVELYNDDFVVSDGQIELVGATVPVIDLYIDAKKVDVKHDGTFSIELEDVTANEITYTMVDVFGNERAQAIKVVYEGVPVWEEDETLLIEAIEETSISLSWGAAVEEDGIAYYHLYQDGEAVAQVDGTETSYVFTDLNSSTEYEFMVEAEGVSGKRSEPLEIMVKTEKSAEEIAEETVDEAFSVIDSLPSKGELVLADRADVETARGLVEEAIQLGASEDDIKNLSKLVELEEEVEELETQAEAREKALLAAETAIEALPDEAELTIEDQPAVEEARELVEQATDLGASEMDIEKLPKLVALEEKIRELEREAKAIAALQEVETAIEALPSVDELTLDDKPAVEQVREKVREVDELGISELDVDNLTKLVDLEDRITELKFQLEAREVAEGAIDRLPSVDSLTEINEPNVRTARDLVDEAVELGVVESEITNLDKLIALEKKLSQLKQEKRISLADLKDLPDKNDVQLTDVPTHWARDDINTLTKKEIILGYPDSSFGPDRNISRAEVMVIVSRIVTPFADGEQLEWTFEDSAPEWARDAILGGVSLGLIQGYPSNEFGAGDQITRAELVMILNRVVELVDENDQKNIESTVEFNDEIPEWAQEEIKTITQLGIINGYDDQTFRPQAKATRAEVAAVMNRLLQ
ncbi:S-layer homology domain-containing protein [Desertibacillus haloalkaliphilus]|uniref:S-layer homology domain-containing protein n=1 Tax=Desertibacillus haloalkaliphilus TaxID=1328930 RepID=UPI001C261C65|nr:S-layer homology domain-containing protein [Desertibacillus haloalkaliphilus]MBU8906005.1 S-layer homology domain-containing protein [Desertibacillus haloalkaliphilus]